MRQESHSPSSSSSSSSPTVSEIQTREREDRIDSDLSPVQLSNSVGDGSGQPDETQANKTPKTNKKETTIERGNSLNSEIPEWLQEFRENLVDDEIPLQGGSHASSSHEGSRRIREKPKLHKKPGEACKSSWNPKGILKSFTLTIPWNSVKLVKISPGIIARLHHTDRRLMVLLKEQCAE